MNTNSRNVTYSTVGDYQLPNLTLNQPRKPLGKYGRLRRTYLKDHRPVLYNTMLLNGSLYPHLMEVEQTAESRMQQTMEQLLKQDPAPDKAQNQLMWVQHMNTPSWTGGKGVCKVLRAGSGWKDKKVLFHNKRRKEATPGKRKRMERIRRSSEKCSGRCMLWIDRNI